MTSTVKLIHLQSPDILALRAGYGTLSEFARHPAIGALQWPLDVVEQWLWEFLDWPAFLADYGDLNLAAICWRREEIPAKEFLTMTTGASEAELLEYNAERHSHWTAVRSEEIRVAWEVQGTWLRAPVLLDRDLLKPSVAGLQVVEGRTRVGIARGRLRDGLHVATALFAWVGRPRPESRAVKSEAPTS